MAQKLFIVDEAIRVRSPLYGTQAMPIMPPVPPGAFSRAAQRFSLTLLPSPPPDGVGGW